MSRLKKVVTGFGVGVWCMVIMSITAFAVSYTSSTVSDDLLHCELYGNREEVVSITSLDENRDMSYLTAGLTVVNKQGVTLMTIGKKSARGELTIILRMTNLSSDCYTVFSVHGREGGRTTDAVAVYKSLRLD